MLAAAFDVYWLTRDYTDEVGDNGEHMSAGKLQEYAQDLEDYRAAYREIHRYLVGNLINTGSLSGSYDRVTIELDAYVDDYDETNPAIYSRVETPTPPPAPTPAPGAAAEPSAAPASSPEPVYYIDGDKVTALMEELETAKDEFVAAKNNFENAGRDLMNTLPGSGTAMRMPSSGGCRWMRPSIPMGEPIIQMNFVPRRMRWPKHTPRYRPWGTALPATMYQQIGKMT